MSSRRKNNKQKTYNCSSTLQKNLSLLKNLNKEMALNMQRLKEDLSNTITQNLSLKGELYETLMDRNCLWESNMRLMDLLRTLQAEYLTFGKRIENLLCPKDGSSSMLNADTLGDLLPDTQNPETPRDIFPNMENAESYLVPSDPVIHTNNFEPGILYSRKSPGAVYLQVQDANNLSPITEEQCEDIVTSRLGRRSRLTQSIAHSRNSGCEEAFCSTKCSSEKNLSGCIIFRNKEELNGSPVDVDQPVTENEEVSDLVAENMILLEEGKSMKRRCSLAGGRSSLAGRRKSSLLTINIMQQQSDTQASPPVFVNVVPRKRRYASKLSLNDGFLDIGFSEETSKKEDSKIPTVVLERLPLMEDPLSPIINQGPSKEKSEISPVAKQEKRKSTKKSWRPSIPKYQNSTDRRRSFRNHETVSYKEFLD